MCSTWVVNGPFAVYLQSPLGWFVFCCFLFVSVYSSHLGGCATCLLFPPLAVKHGYRYLLPSGWLSKVVTLLPTWLTVQNTILSQEISAIKTRQSVTTGCTDDLEHIGGVRPPEVMKGHRPRRWDFVFVSITAELLLAQETLFLKA